MKALDLLARCNSLAVCIKYYINHSKRFTKNIILCMPAFNCFIYVIVLIYLNTEALSKATIVLLEVPFSLVDAVWYPLFPR